MESSGAIIDRVMREQQKQIMELQQQNKHLIEELTFYADESTYDVAHLDKHGYIIIDSDCGAKAQLALQQIKGKEDER
jgi:hypothetical protein